MKHTKTETKVITTYTCDKCGARIHEDQSMKVLSLKNVREDGPPYTPEAALHDRHYHYWCLNETSNFDRYKGLRFP
jgi:ribosomal protein S26